MVTSFGFILSWNNPPPVDWNGLIRSFIINITEHNTGVEYQLMTTSNEIHVNFLHPFYRYLCSVAAVTVSAGPYSTLVVVTTLSAGMFMVIFLNSICILSGYAYINTAPTGTPQNVLPYNVEATSIHLLWDPPVDSEQNGHIISYSINMTTQTGERVVFTSNVTNYTFQNLEPYKIYEFTLAAETASGSGPYTSSLQVRSRESGQFSLLCVFLYSLILSLQNHLYHLIM